MDDIPLSTLVIALLACLLLSGFFSMSETAMMAINRYRLASLSKQGNPAALRTTALLRQTDKLLGVILLGNTLINTAAATLTTLVTAKLFGNNEIALGIGTMLIAFAILIFSEATPKILAANHAEKIALAVSLPLRGLLWLFYPAVWFVNLFVAGLLRLMRLKTPSSEQQPLRPEELKILILEASHFIEKKHHSILLNLFELEKITVDDVMTPRHQVEALDLDRPIEEIRRQLASCQHTRLPIYRDDIGNIQGILHIRKVRLNPHEELNRTAIEDVMRPPYYIPAGTALFTQLQNFQENQRRLGLVVDEYGELQGLVSLEDILELIVGEFTTQTPTQAGQFRQLSDGAYLLEGRAVLRELNRKLQLDFPLEGPKTLNGLILEHFQAIPEDGTCMEIGSNRLEIVQTQDRSIKTVKLYPPRPARRS